MYVASVTLGRVTVRLDVYPDGGMARLRVWGELVDPPATTSADDVSGRRAAR